MNKQEVLTLVRGIISQAVSDVDIKDDDSFFALGIDSLSIMQVQVELARSFGLKLNFRELSKYSSVEKLSDYITEKLTA